tara:strand:+ start:193 stop:1029 length:837 start_codon:yes stop_codon:yes gene_type:complete
MSAQDNGFATEAEIAEQLAASLSTDPDNSDESAAEAVEESEESAADESSDSQAEDNSAQDSDTQEEQADEAVDFDFQSTSTGVERLVQKFGKLDAEEQSSKVENLKKSGRTKELEALKDAYPDAFSSNEDKSSLGDVDIDALIEAKLKERGFDPSLLEKLSETLPKYETQIRDSMLKEVLGGEYDQVLADPKFLTAYNRFAQLGLEERLEVACSMSPIARKLKYDKDYAKESRSRNAGVPAKGSVAPKAAPKEKTKPESYDDFRAMNSPESILKALQG